MSTLKTDSLLKLIVLFVFLVLLSSGCEEAYLGPTDEHGTLLDDQDLPYRWESWMGHLSDSLYLSQITIPGTHDSGADKHTSQVGWPQWHYVICQDFKIENQLKLGVRWLDIRLKYHGDDDLSVHHSVYYLHKSFDAVLDYSIDFLKDHPSEVVILMIKQEDSSVSDHKFGERVYKKMKDHGLHNFYLERKVPTLGEVRGKIFIVRRFVNHTSNDFGIYFHWPENTTGSMQHYSDYSLYVQDHYSLHTVSTDTKYDEVVDCIKKAHENTDQKKFYLNFVSGERVPGETLWKTADDINYKVEEYLDGHAKNWHHLGIIMINFAGGGDVNSGGRNCAPNLVKKIIYRNPGISY